MCSQLASVGILFSIIMIKSYSDVLKTEAGKTDIVRIISFCLKVFFLFQLDIEKEIKNVY